MEGQGGPPLDTPAIAKRPAPALAAQIRNTMPITAPGSLSVQEAEALAAYLQHAHDKP